MKSGAFYLGLALLFTHDSQLSTILIYGAAGCGLVYLLAWWLEEQSPA